MPTRVSINFLRVKRRSLNAPINIIIRWRLLEQRDIIITIIVLFYRQHQYERFSIFHSFLIRFGRRVIHLKIPTTYKLQVHSIYTSTCIVYIYSVFSKATEWHSSKVYIHIYIFLQYYHYIKTPTKFQRHLVYRKK